MKILYISQFFKPEKAAGALRAFDMAKVWNEHEEIVVMTAYPNFPEGKIFGGYKPKLITKECIEDINIIRSKIIAKGNNSKVSKIISSISFLFFGVVNLIFKRKKIGREFDIILGTSGTILAPIIAYIASRIYKARFVLELRDITYNQLLAVYSNKKNILYKIVKFIELYLCKKADKIVVVTNGFKNELIHDGIEEQKIEVYFNGFNKDILKYNLETNNEEKITFSYIGNLGKSQNLLFIIELFESINLDDNNKCLYIIGDGSEKENIKSFIIEKDIHNVFVLDSMENEKLENYYEKTDISIVSLKNNNFFKNTIPSKIFQNMGRGKVQMYFGPEGEATEILKKSESALIFTDIDIEVNINKVNSIINNKGVRELKSEFKFMGKKGMEFCNLNYNRKKIAIDYLESMRKLVSQGE